MMLQFSMTTVLNFTINDILRFKPFFMYLYIAFKTYHKKAINQNCKNTDLLLN